MMLSGWGRFPRAECQLIEPRSREEVVAAIVASKNLIGRGNGRSYGDSALNSEMTLGMCSCGAILDFDHRTGRVTCEGGTLLAAIIERFVPLGWFPPVTPGTKFVTIGGMIAADVHGKNHHGTGSFGTHIENLELALADGRVARCSHDENGELFAATCGGMGLTGVILQATFRMIPIQTRFVRQETVRVHSLHEAMARFEESENWSYSVAWLDCLATGPALGRSLLFRGEHATFAEIRGLGRDGTLAMPSNRPWRVPIDFPPLVLNTWTTRAFNALYYHRARPGVAFVDIEEFFYPLDAILDWNRIYGRSGFFQYHCLLPKSASLAGLSAILEKIRAAGSGSFLSVLKLFGKQEGLLSFPKEGYTLALDFPVNRANLGLADELDAIVADHSGSIYLAKDARMSPKMMRLSYPELERFHAIRAAVDPGRKFTSIQSCRLDI